MSPLPESSGIHLPPGCWPRRASPVGYASSALEPEETQKLAALAAQVLNDPMALQRLSDRVFTLLKQDLKQEQERRGGYGRRSR